MDKWGFLKMLLKEIAKTGAVVGVNFYVLLMIVGFVEQLFLYYLYILVDEPVPLPIPLTEYVILIDNTLVYLVLFILIFLFAFTFPFKPIGYHIIFEEKPRKLPPGTASLHLIVGKELLEKEEDDKDEEN